ncbi:MAG TPA: YihY/virulence factor BrkB family protein [Thermoanaerobaculia bacterium]|nr:YihY/virulence factor BrkB family protein [Thermoanaerobaculia bacterium]
MRASEEHGRQRGRWAERPRKIPKRGWREVLQRVKREVGDDHLMIVAAGIAFYAMLALFPALFAALSIYGLVASPAEVAQQISSLAAQLPQATSDLLTNQLQSIAANSETALGWSAALSILFALWSASKGAKALIKGVNIAYDEEETRGFLKLQGLALAFTVGFIVFGILSLGAIAVLPGILASVGLGPVGEVLAQIGRWALLVVLVLVALATVYRFAPDRSGARWTWLRPGSLIAAALWLVASGLFSWYASSFGSFNETYGAIAGAVVLLLWLQISSLVVLLGAELNSELEHQTVTDTTTGQPQPMGERGAVKADTLPDDVSESERRFLSVERRSRSS